MFDSGVRKTPSSLDMGSDFCKWSPWPIIFFTKMLITLHTLPHFRNEGTWWVSQFFGKTPVPAHFALRVSEFLNREFSGRWIGLDLTLYRLFEVDLTCNISLWGYSEKQNFPTSVITVNDLTIAVRQSKCSQQHGRKCPREYGKKKNQILCCKWKTTYEHYLKSVAQGLSAHSVHFYKFSIHCYNFAIFSLFRIVASWNVSYFVHLSVLK